MTEDEWQTCAEPEMMLAHLRRRERQPSARKFRLFCIACCRHSVAVMRYARNRHCLAVAERCAEGLAGDDERREVRRPLGAYAAAINAAGDDPMREASLVASDVAFYAAIAAEALGGEREPARRAEAAALCDLLRDVVGNPYREPRLDPAWLAGGVAVRLAEGIYEERAFDRVPVLADALEEAGCADEAILSHLRSPGPHVRGCWAVDLVLGKQ
jgi:hypothetical protein